MARVSAQARKYPIRQDDLLTHSRWLTDFLYATQTEVKSLQRRALTRQTADQYYSPQALRPHLLGGGAHALVITGMMGRAGEAQPGDSILRVDVLANIGHGLGSSAKGELFFATDVGHVFEWMGNAWGMLDGAGYGTFATGAPVPNSFWTSIPVIGGTASVTKVDGSGRQTVSFGAYTAPGAGYLLYVRI